MKRLVVSQSLVEVESLKEFLSADGILCTIRNQQGSSLAGEVPFVEVFPELWVVNDADFDRAKELLEEQGSGDEVERPTWACAGCGEKLVGLFTACWKCGQKQDSNSSPNNQSIRETDHEIEDAPQRQSSSSGLLVGILIGIGLTVIAYWAWNYFSLTGTPYDRNVDGKDDMVYEYVGRVLHGAKFDNNFDGFYETSSIYNQNGDVIRTEIDRNRDGKPDVIEYNTLGKLDSLEFIDPATGKVRKRMFYKLDVKVREEIDQDGDGVFEKVIKFDEYENPLP